MEKEQNKANLGKKQDKYYDIFLTDVQMHVVEPRKPIPWYRVISRSLINRKPGRFYTTHFEMNDKERTIKLSFPPSPKTQQQTEEAKKKGKTIRFITPKNGIPVCLGKDVIEKLEADTNKLKKKKNFLTRFWRSDNIN